MTPTENPSNAPPFEKSRSKDISEYITWILLGLLLVVIVYAQIDGMYISKQYYAIEMCNKKPIGVYAVTPIGYDEPCNDVSHIAPDGTKICKTGDWLGDFNTTG